MMLIYTHKITPRLTYIFRHIFVRILNVPVDFTSKIEVFVAYNGLKMNYSKVPLGNELFVRSHDLLFEQGINDVDITISNWEADVPCFFNAGKKSAIPYDIFAASFYLISRYEEYLPHVQDQHERFSVQESLAFQHKFLKKPVIDIWSYKFLEVLQQKFPNYEFVPRQYNYISTFDVNQAFIYRSRGIVRTIGGFINDFFTLQWSAVIDRILVLFKLRKDPYDTYDKIVEIKKSHGVETVLFFLISSVSTFDNNISITKNNFRLLIKSMSDYVKIGLGASYFTMKKEDLLKKETKKLASIINTPVCRSRQHMLRNHLPETYQNLIDLEIDEEYSMGYSSHLGFRAGTCTPFYFYDLDFEIQTPLKIIPFAVSDTVLNTELKLSYKQAVLQVLDMCNEVKKVNGTFSTLFHNELLSDYGIWKGWSGFYEDVVELAKEQS